MLKLQTYQTYQIVKDIEKLTHFIEEILVDNNEDYYELKIETANDRLDDYFRKYKLVYKKLSKIDDRHSISVRIGCLNHERARKLLFKILDEKIEGWWD